MFMLWLHSALKNSYLYIGTLKVEGSICNASLTVLAV
jgi:hypothetical protein